MHEVTIQCTVSKNSLPDEAQLMHWAKHALKLKTNSAELNIRVVDIQEITDLNYEYRHKNKATNVLSFPFDMPEEIEDEIPFLGDVVICAEVVNREALEQDITREAHWAHMIVHGILHLLGYDHETDAEAEIMELLEIDILKSLGFPNPYLIEDNDGGN